MERLIDTQWNRQTHRWTYKNNQEEKDKKNDRHSKLLAMGLEHTPYFVKWLKKRTLSYILCYCLVMNFEIKLIIFLSKFKFYN